MGLTQKLGTIPLAIQTDSSNNVGIGGAANASYKLAVTGASLFTGALTATGQVEGTIINSTSNAFRLNGNNALSLVTIGGQNVVKINAGGFWGTHIVGANDQGIIINNTASVGIGSTTIYNGGGWNRVLSLYEASSVAISLVTNAKQWQIGIAGTDNDYRIYDYSNSAYRFAINGSTGYIGVNTNEPKRLLDVRGTVNLSTTTPTVGTTSGAYADVHLRTYSGYPSAQAKIVVVDYWMDFYSTYTDGFRWFNWDSAGTTPVERMRISGSGDVYIGGTTSLLSGALIVGDNSSTRPIVIRGQNGVDGTYITGIAFYPWNTAEVNTIQTTVSGSASASGFRFMVSNGYGTTGTTESLRVNRTSVTVIGSLSKGSGSFKIDHPIESMSETHHLVHSFVESPQANNIYRGKVQLVNGKAEVNLDEVSTMTDGTFVLLNRDIHTYTSNETDWDAVRGKVDGNILTIECQNNQSNVIVSWLVIGERQDKHMMDTEWTDKNGKVIVEPLKEVIELENKS